MEKEIEVIAEDEVEVITTESAKQEIELTEEQAKVGAAQVSELLNMLDYYTTPRERLSNKITHLKEQLANLSVDNYRYRLVECEIILLEKKLNPQYVYKHDVKGIAKTPYVK